ncbi:hypothetical protein QJS04_geneDACA015826 [Acorus gramineus]|uniref:Peroxiredoxin n=1 Tax=Acorus gramineus TaxID=55184 RepID=A0AAV9BSQ1_ACOGR|nr:hypothetical protein QJS04_geneDACA015826 [Acorus gramineus]
MPGLTIGDTIPNLEVETTLGKFKIHDYIGNGWAIIFSHPGDFTPVCTTELGKMALYAEEFKKRGVKLLGVSCEDVKSHIEWIKDIEAYTPGCEVKYPIAADTNMEIIQLLNMVDPVARDTSGNQLPSRALHIIGPDKKIKLSFLYPATTGRNMEEVMRVLESLQVVMKHKVATPVNWKPGEPVVVSPSLSNEEAKKMFPQGFQTKHLPSKKEYLRFTKL